MGETDQNIEDARDPSILELAGLLGVHTEYTDMWGTPHKAPESTLRAVLSTMGHSDVASSIKKVKTLPWGRFIEPVFVVLENNQPAFIPIRFPLDEGRDAEVTLVIEFTDEDGRHEKRVLEGITPAEETLLEGKRHVRVDIPNDVLRSIGYHTLKVQATLPGDIRKKEGSMRLIVTPELCHRPEGRSWGLTLSLYGLRSERNAGAGDLGDLERIASLVGDRLKAGFIGINPLHDVPNSLAEGISPYSPISRLYRSLLYIDLSQVPFLDKLDKQELNKAEEQASTLRQTDMVDYEGVTQLKTSLMIKAFERFKDALESDRLPKETAHAYRDYLEREGEALELHATFLALSAQIRDTLCMGRNWLGWPEEFRNPKSQAITDFRNNHAMEVEFQMFVQWVLEEQMANVARQTDGMQLGLYQDLAVGSSDCGSDTWACQDIFALGMNTGAPPDDFNPLGQNWIFPPLLPERLKETGYDLFARTIRANLRHSGALRIDHALGLFRIYFIPEGRPPSEGTYVDFPSEDLLGIIALESVRAEAVIIAEDLGTVTQEAREGLSRRGMLSYRILYFERNWEQGNFLPPEAYPQNALSAINTHDLPTFRGFWEGRDIEHKKRLGIIDEEACASALATREKDKSLLIEALTPYISSRGLDPSDISNISIAAHCFLAATPTLLASASLDDITNSSEQQNMPGTTSGHPNWKRKSLKTLEQIVKSIGDDNDMLTRIARLLHEAGRAEGNLNV